MTMTQTSTKKAKADKAPTAVAKGKGRKATKAKGKATSKAVSTAGKDQFGFRLGAATSKTAALLLKGATMQQIKEKTGSFQYNVIKRLEAKGHEVVKEGKVYRVTLKS